MFSKPIKLISILGFQIKLDMSWLLIAALIVWSLSSNYFPATHPGFERRTYLILSVLGMLGLFASLILHEMSHAIVARRFGLGIEGITLFLFGGVAELKDEPESATSEFWIAVVGPLTSFALAAMFWFIGELIRVVADPTALSALISYLATINLILAIFNLLPAFPLDGGRILRAFLWYRSGALLKATYTASRISSTLAYMLIALGFFALFFGSQIGGIWQILIGLFVLFAAQSSYRDTLRKTAFSHKTVSSIMSETVYTVAPSTPLSDLVNQTMLRHSVSFVPVVEDNTLLGYIDNKILRNIDRENWGNTQVEDVFVALEDGQTISPTLPVSDLMEKIKETGQRKFMVVDDAQLVGILSLSDLTAFLSVFADVVPKVTPASTSPPAQAAI